MDKEKDKSFLKKIVVIFIIITILCLIIILYARYIGTKGIVTNEIKLVETSLTEEFKGFKIVHISDIHYGKIVTEKELNELIEKVNATKPDIIVLTGDLINKDCILTEENKTILITFLQNLKANIKKYAISGENDTLFAEFDNILKEGNFINLDDDFDTIYNGKLNYILISGIGTNAKESSLNATLQFIESTETKPIYQILLTHKPDVIDELDMELNLVLSGHSLRGSVYLPIIGPLYLPEGATKYYDNFYEINHTKLYVSNGIGTNEYNFRLFNKPSFNFYRMTNKQ